MPARGQSGPRALVLTTSFPRTPGDPSGHFVAAHARRLAASGFEVHVVAPGGSVRDRPLPHPSFVLHPAGGGSLFGWPGARARAAAAPWRLGGAASFAAGARARIRGIRDVDLIAAHWILPSAFPLALGVGGRLEGFAHGEDVRMLVAAPALAREAALRSILARARTITFASASLFGALRAALDKTLAEKLDAVARIEPPPLELPELTRADPRAPALRAELGLASGEKLLVCVSRLVPEKRVELVVEATARLPFPARLVIVGDGPSRPALERAARRGSGVVFTGTVPRSEALAWIAAADVLVHASRVEGAPTVVREARALGTAVVACESGDLGAWARADAGIRLARAGTREALAHAISSTVLAFGDFSTSVRPAVDAGVPSSTRPGA